MALKEILADINESVKDIVNMGFELTQTQGDYVPHYDDPGLTFESGRAKRAKLIETCVLYADIRDSTVLSKTKSKEVMARLYTAFVKSILMAAEHHGGVIRNIIGDRVMVVFPANNCFTAAVDTAISINTISSRIINKHFSGFDFKCGIGIDYGEMKVIKAGIPKQDKERTSYKNLVWIGNAANIASKLTDVANKEIANTVYRVTRIPNNPKAWRAKVIPGIYGPIITSDIERVPAEPLLLDTIEKVDMSAEEFAKSIWQSKTDKTISTQGGKMLEFERTEKKITPAPILMTEAVWNGFSKANLTRKDVTEKMWRYQSTSVKEYIGKIIGGELYWSIIDEIRL